MKIDTTIFRGDFEITIYGEVRANEYYSVCQYARANSPLEPEYEVAVFGAYTQFGPCDLYEDFDIEEQEAMDYLFEQYEGDLF